MKNRVWSWCKNSINALRENFHDFSPDINFKHLFWSGLVVFFVAELNNLGTWWALTLAAIAALTGSVNDVVSYLRHKGNVPTVKTLFKRFLHSMFKRKNKHSTDEEG